MIEEIFILTTETCQKHPVTVKSSVSHRFPISTRQNISEARNRRGKGREVYKRLQL